MELALIEEFFINYGWQLGLLSLSGIVLLGFLKWFGAFEKLAKNVRKYLYFGLSCVLSIVACTIYVLACGTFDAVSYLLLCVAVIGITIVAYHFYEHTGLRTAWNKVLNLIEKLFKFIISAIITKTLTEDKLKAKAIELGSQVLADLTKTARENELKAEQAKQPTEVK